MATVVEGYELTVSLADNGANVTTLKYQGNGAVLTDFTEAQAARDALITDLLAVTNSVFVGDRLTEVRYNDALAYPAAGIENEDKASVTFLIQDTNKKGNLQIPAPKIGLFVNPTGPSANIVNVQAAILTAYCDNFRTTGGWYISDGEFLQTILKGKRISAKNNNG